MALGHQLAREDALSGRLRPAAGVDERRTINSRAITGQAEARPACALPTAIWYCQAHVRRPGGFVHGFHRRLLEVTTLSL